MLRVARQLWRTSLPATMTFLEFILLSTRLYAALASLATPGWSRLGTNNRTDITVQGTTTFYWSIRNDPLKRMPRTSDCSPTIPSTFRDADENIYGVLSLIQSAWHEAADFSTLEMTFLTVSMYRWVPYSYLRVHLFLTSFSDLHRMFKHSVRAQVARINTSGRENAPWYILSSN